jgi:ATP-dependent DNA ligase
VRLYSRPGNDLTERFPLIVEACARSCIIRCILAAEQLDILEGSHPASFFFP